MAVSDGQNVNAAVTNAAFVSKTSATNQQMVGTLDLNNSGSTQVPDVQAQINTNITNISTNTSDIATNAANIASNLGSITTLQSTAPTTDEKAALVGTGTPSASNVYVTDDDTRLSGAETTFTLANNVSSATDVTGLLLASGTEHGAQVEICLRRRDDSEERMSIGKIVLVYLQDAAVWDLAEDLNENVDDGVTFSVTAAGQVQYTSDNMAGANYFGELKFKINKFGTFSS